MCAGIKDAVAVLQSSDSKRVITERREQQDVAVAFMFPGQGAQYVNMGLSLYREEPLFRANVDVCSELLALELGVDVRTVLYPDPTQTETAQHRITETYITQPALFVIEYALAQLWMKWGIQPAAVIGHSLGEYVAACVAGVLSRDDALMLVAKRARLMQEMEGGAMLAVLLPERELEPLLSSDLAVAAVNSPLLTVVSGPYLAVENLRTKLGERGVESRDIRTSHAFHSAMMDPVLGSFAEFVSHVKISPPRIPWISCLSGDWIDTIQATDANYWTEQLRRTVRFAAGVEKLLAGPATALLEVGPGSALSAFVKQHPNRSAEHVVLTSLHHSHDSELELNAMLQSLGQLWIAGAQVNWPSVHKETTHRRISLPTYPFERKRYWIDPPKPSFTSFPERIGDEPDNGKLALLQDDRRSAIADPKEEQMRLAHTGISSTGGKARILETLKNIMHDLSGIDPASIDGSSTFVELGFDSLLMTRLVAEMKKRFGVRVLLRRLFEDLTTIEQIASHLAQEAPSRFVPPAEASTPTCATETIPAQPAPTASGEVSGNFAEMGLLLQRQLELVKQHVDILSRQIPGATSATSDGRGGKRSLRLADAPKTFGRRVRAFGPFKPVKGAQTAPLSNAQQKYIKKFITGYNERTRGSKSHAERYRTCLSDPRTVAGFRREWKEAVYPVVSRSSRGCRIIDVDGNEYLDILMGFGAHLFGHSPPFLREALGYALDTDISLGPQSVLAGEAAELFCRLTGAGRMTYAQGGSEAVLGALRIARTVTGKDRIAMFYGSYHGRVDCVVARPTVINGKIHAVPQVPGIPRHMVSDVLILDYGDPASVEIIRNFADELAAVIVEPVQSRNPSNQPRDFLHQLRAVTEQHDMALVFDEIVTGFRTIRAVHRPGLE